MAAPLLLIGLLGAGALALLATRNTPARNRFTFQAGHTYSATLPADQWKIPDMTVQEAQAVLNAWYPGLLLVTGVTPGSTTIGMQFTALQTATVSVDARDQFTDTTSNAPSSSADCQTLAGHLGIQIAGLSLGTCTAILNAINSKNIAAIQALAAQLTSQFPLLAQKLLGIAAELAGIANVQCQALGQALGVAIDPSLPPATCAAVATAIAQKNVAALSALAQQISVQFPALAQKLMGLLASWSSTITPTPTSTSTDCSALAHTLGISVDPTLPAAACTQVLQAVQQGNISVLGQLAQQYPQFTQALTALIQKIAAMNPNSGLTDCQALALVAPPGLDANVPDTTCTQIMNAIRQKNTIALATLAAQYPQFPMLGAKIAGVLLQSLQGTA